MDDIPKGKTGKVLKKTLRESHIKQCQSSKKNRTQISKGKQKQHIEQAIIVQLSKLLPEENQFQPTRTFTGKNQWKLSRGDFLEHHMGTFTLIKDLILNDFLKV